MKGCKRVIAVLMSLVIITTVTLCDTQKAHAMSIGTVALTVAGAVCTAWGIKEIHEQAYKSYHSGVWQKIHEDASRNLGPMGFIMTANPEAEVFDKYIRPIAKKRGWIEDSDSESQAFEKIKEHMDSGYKINSDNSITMNQDIKNFYLDYENQFKADSGYFYAYTFNCDLSLTSFSKGPQAQALQSIVKQYQNDYYVTETYNNNNGELTINCFPKGKVYFVKSSEGEHVTYKTDWTNGNTANPSAFGGFGKRIKADGSIYDYNYKDMFTEHYTTQSNATFNGAQAHWVKLCTSGQVFSYKVFNNLNSLMSYDIGQAPYYINNSVNSSVVNSSGDYIINTDNSNHATYGDITSYVDSYNTENNTNPKDDDINIYIENKPAPTPEPTPTPSPDNPSGGGSGYSVSGNTGGNASATATAQGGNSSANNEGINITNNNNPVINFILGGSDTVSGNGSGGSGINFGFLGALGSTLKSLIENIGKAIVDLVAGITEVITSLVEVIPTVFTNFVSAILGWLPPELAALVSVGVLAIILVGVVKIFRG